MTPALWWALACGEPTTAKSTEKDPDTAEVDTQDTVDTQVETADTDTGEPDTTETGETGDTDTSGSLCNELDTADGEVPRCDRSQPWVSVAAGGGITCGVHEDGCAECWGAGKEEDGDGGYWYRHEDIPPDESFSKIAMHGGDSYASAGFHLCGLTTDGRIRCWADGLSEEMLEIEGDFVDVAVWSLGAHAVGADGTLSYINVGYAPAGDTFVAVRSGAHEMVALRQDGSAVSFLYHYEGFDQERTGPFVRVDAGDYVCGLRVDGGFECWAGGGISEDLSSVPIVADAPTGLVDFCQTLYAACGLDAEGYVTCWGEPYWFPGNWPTDIQFSQLGCGVSHACGITPEGEMHCWSDMDYYCETVVPT